MSAFADEMRAKFAALEGRMNDFSANYRPAVVKRDQQRLSRRNLRAVKRTIVVYEADQAGAAASAGDAALVAAKAYTDAQIAAISLSAFLDAQFGSTQGGVIFRGATGWTFLPNGAPADRLTSGGPAADLTWAP